MTSPTRLVPFHKLSQWLAYSLIEPLEALGIVVTGIDELTGLAEYRNGGLFIDLGVLRPRDPAVLGNAHEPGSEIVVEWRALTVALLDRLAPLGARGARSDARGVAARKDPRGWHLERGAAYRQSAETGRRPAASHHQRWHGILGLHTPTEKNMETTSRSSSIRSCSTSSRSCAAKKHPPRSFASS